VLQAVAAHARPAHGVDHEHVEPAEPLDDLGDGGLDGLGPLEIEVDGHLAGLLGRLAVDVVGDRDPRALGREGLRRRPADAARPAGHEHGLACQPGVHVDPLSRSKNLASRLQSLASRLAG
jgi:hypothetical protein